MSDTWDSAPLVQKTPAAASSWDSAPLVGPSAQQTAVTKANDDADGAARAMKLGKQMNLPPTVVQSDLTGYAETARQQGARNAVETNKYLASYVNDNPMAASVSGDDYDHLQEVSETLQALRPDAIKGKRSVGVIAAVPEIASMMGDAAGRDKLWNALTKLPGAMAKGMLDFFETPGNVLSGKTNLTTAEGIDAGISMGLGVALGSGRVRAGAPKGLEGVTGEGALAGNEVALQRVRISKPMTFDDFMHQMEGFNTRKEIDDFINSRHPGPPGAVLQIEHAKAGQAALDKAVEVAQSSKTKERSPELFEEMAKKHDDGVVHIPGDKIIELYQQAGKIPAEGDGLFGFVPDIAAKAESASATGGEVTIPVSKYLAHIDPTVHQGLKDSVRLHDDGVTREEAKELEKEVQAFDPEAPKVAEPTDPVAVERKNMKLDKSGFMDMLFEKGESLGITESEIKKYSEKIANQEQAILDRAEAAGRREASRALTPEWKRNEAKVRDEVTTEFREKGAFAAAKYLRDNKIELKGDRIDAIADDLAPLFGFETGMDLRRGLTELETEQAASGKSPQRQLPDAIKAEVARRMEERYGSLEQNIAKEAREIALAEHTFDVLAEETRLLAKAAGTTSPIGRNEMVSWAKRQFEAANIAEAGNWEKHRRAVEKNGREAEKALLKGDFAEAFQFKQKQFLAATLARASMDLQKVIDGTERKIDRFQSQEVIEGLNQAYLEQIRQVLASVGLPQYFAPLRDTPALRDMVAESEGQLAVASWLTDGSQPKLQDMSVQQFREFADSLKSLEHVGRQVDKLITAHGEATLQNAIFDFKKEVERFPFVEQPGKETATLAQHAKSVGRYIIGSHLLVEKMFDYIDKYNPDGPLTTYIDRPLRDSNRKELELTEKATKMLRDLYPLVDASTAELIPNDLIPDALMKSGFKSMTRNNLRQVMLNMGNRSNIQKLTEGFGINEADLRRWVDKHATAKDVAYVNGIWDVFNMLKPEADAMQLRDTGVPVDTIPAVEWDIKAGKLKGGYYPIVFDKINSDIQGHLAAKNPLFDNHYVQATTPKGYTVERTGYKGALDLEGAFLASRIQGQIHDIAFREAVRSANRLISNQEFRTALAQRWGKEYVELLPGWLKSIANAHALDDSYAQGLARGMALVRQNVINTLIGYNPTTVLKHGASAAILSANRVGLGPLLTATKELGIKDTWETAKDLVRRGEGITPDEAFMQAFRDNLDQGTRGEQIRQFVLQSSAVMRNRARQVDDSIRGAIDKMNELGVTGAFKNAREKNMLYGRFAVAMSDQISAVPTWYAAYKEAYMSGRSHEDAVFMADKEVSRAHGSSFVGDQPAVTRLGNSPRDQFLKMFTGLYKFYNHFANKNFEFAWDAAEFLRGNKRQEPGANAANLSRWIAGVVGVIVAEQMAMAALDKDKKGPIHSAMMGAAHLFGGQFIGVRDITNYVTHGGQGPASGLVGTVVKMGEEAVKDLGRATGARAGEAKNWIKHTADVIGVATGLTTSQMGRTGQFLTKVAQGKERPRNFDEWRQGLRTGSTKARVH